MTSGTFSPTFERGLCMAYVRGAVGGALEVAIGKAKLPLVPTELPFYKRPRTKARA